MDHITIPIPDGMDERQKADLVGWLTKQVEEVTPDRLACEDDAKWRAELGHRIKLGMDEIAAGSGVEGDQALRDIAGKHGLTLHG